MLTQDRLKELVSYDPKSGLMVWRVNRGKARKGQAMNTKDKDGYLRTTVDQRYYQVHRLVFLYMAGEWPDETDHINGIRDDNRWCNLRSVSRRENVINAAMRSTNRSGVCGVRYDNKTKKWYAYITVDKKSYYLGTHDSKGSAAHARWKAERRFGFTERHGKRPTIDYPRAST